MSSRQQQQRNQLAREMATRPRVIPRPATERWDIVANITHAVVCEASHTDGFGCCLWYAAFGMVLASRAFGKPFSVQAGDLHLRPDPFREELTSFMGSLPGAPGRGEFHAWCASPGEDGAFEAVDFSSRHYPRLVEDIPSIIAEEMVDADHILTVAAPSRLRWRRAAPPSYLRVDVGKDGCWPLDWASLLADEQCCVAVQENVLDMLKIHRTLVVRAGIRLHDELAGLANPNGGQQ
jgi:hypothetical protein